MYVFKEYDNIYDWISCLKKDLIYFGPYPNQLMIDKMTDEKFETIVDLTSGNEEEKYNTKETTKYIHFPIEDNNIPVSITSYGKLIAHLKNDVLNNKKIYIHCRGGHGRSSMVAVSLFYYLSECDLRLAIDTVISSHNERIVLRSKWKRKKSPFNYQQFLFLSKIHKNIYVNMNYYNKYYYWLYYRESVSFQGKTYSTIYELFLDNKIDNNDKFSIISSFFKNKFLNNNELYSKLHLTYLKNFVLSDTTNDEFRSLYHSVIRHVREELFYN